MSFIGIIGDQGSGKTSYLTHWLYLAKLAGKKVVSNYHLGCTDKTCTIQHPIFPHIRMSFDEIAANPDSIIDCYCGFDELGVGADSYEFFSSKGKSLAKLITQVRKREAFVGFTVQRFTLINPRLRAQTSRFFLMEDLDKETQHKNDYVCKGLFKVDVYDGDYRFVKTMTFDSTKTRHLYPTKQIIYA